MNKHIFFILFLSACATPSGNEDPLKNTKKLVKEGHVSLYNNGAFKVPLTEVKLIPPGPDTADIAFSLSGVKARASFLKALDGIKSTHQLVKAGTMRSWQWAGDIRTFSGDVSSGLASEVADDSLYVIKKSIKFPKESLDWSLLLTKKTIVQMNAYAEEISTQMARAGEEGSADLIRGSAMASNDWDQASEDYRQWARHYGAKVDQSLSSSSSQTDTELSQSGRRAFHSLIAAGKKIDQRSIEMSGDVYQTGKVLGKAGDQEMRRIGDATDIALANSGEMAAKNLQTKAKKMRQKTNQLVSTHLNFAKNNFIQGYLSIPQKMEKAVDNVTESFGEYALAFERSEKLRKKYSDKSAMMWNDTWHSIGTDVGESFQKASDEFVNNSSSIGYTLGAIKALSWLTKMVIWDAGLKPLSKMAVSGVGYVGVNGLLYPSMVVVNSGIATTQVAVELTKEVGKGVYQLTAPSAVSAVASVFSVLEYAGGHIGSTLVAGSAKPVEYGMKITGKSVKLLSRGLGLGSRGIFQTAGAVVSAGTVVSGKTIRGVSYVSAPAVAGVMMGTGKVVASTGFVSGKISHASLSTSGELVRGLGFTTSQVMKKGSYVPAKVFEYSMKGAGNISELGIKYIGVPLVAVGIPTTSTGVGVAVGAAGTATGAGYFSAGELAAGSVYVVGNTLSVGTGIAGTTASASAGVALAGYEVVKGITVPSGYIMGSGIVLTYGSLVQLSAQSMLAVADASYLVLSLEGPRWVVYAVKGKLGDGDDLNGGTILNLQKMKEQGEEFQVVPVSDEEMKKVIESTL